jgi:hypothetical protein
MQDWHGNPVMDAALLNSRLQVEVRAANGTTLASCAQWQAAAQSGGEWACVGVSAPTTAGVYQVMVSRVLEPGTQLHGPVALVVTPKRVVNAARTASVLATQYVGATVQAGSLYIQARSPGSCLALALDQG